ncbi:MAG: DMT family transporter [Calditrichaeota bacterium]|nr:DMT family transporter [Calditrichota bacterium]
MSNTTKAVILTFLAIIFWAGAATAFKLALKHLSPPNLLFYSVLISALALSLIVVFSGKALHLLKMDRQFFIHSAIAGFLNPFLYYTILFKAYDLLPGQLAMALNYGWPVTLTVLAVPLLKQRLTVIQGISVFISFTGAVIIATRGSFISLAGVDNTGIFLALSSTLVWAIYWLINTKDKYDPVLKLMVSFLFGFVYILVSQVVFDELVFPAQESWPALGYIGLFEMGITFVIWLTALKVTPSAARISNLIYITPFLSLLALFLIIGEKIFFSTFVGLVLIVSGILMQELYSRKKRLPDQTIRE